MNGNREVGGVGDIAEQEAGGLVMRISEVDIPQERLFDLRPLVPRNSSHHERIGIGILILNLPQALGVVILYFQLLRRA